MFLKPCIPLSQCDFLFYCFNCLYCKLCDPRPNMPSTPWGPEEETKTRAMAPNPLVVLLDSDTKTPSKKALEEFGKTLESFRGVPFRGSQTTPKGDGLGRRSSVFS